MSSPAESWLELPDDRMFWLTGRCNIGRQADNDVVLNVPELSRHHALIAPDGSRFLLSDLHSRNGVYLNRVAITRPVPLRDGDEILLGPVKLRFRRKRRWFGGDDTLSEHNATAALDRLTEQVCWLLMLDVVGSTSLFAHVGSAAVLRQMQAWIGGLRHLIERNGGQINCYAGDAVLAYWPEDTTKPAQFSAALKAIEAWRPESPLPFRLVAHHGMVLFSHSEYGQEMSGSTVNVLFRSEKIAKGLGASAMLSQAVVDTLKIGEECECFGRSSIEGMSDYFVFYGLPAAWLKR